MMKLNDIFNAFSRLPDRVIAAVSGGADSIALLILLHRYYVPHGGKLLAVHVNHGLRGVESDEDQAFVQAMCKSLSVPLYVKRLYPQKSESELWARDNRYRALSQVARETGCADICTAHHRNDQAQTVLLHLMRGAGLDGLTGMRFETKQFGLTVYRPLLTFAHDELCEYLTQEGISWRQDSSNRSDDYLRNRVRNELIPLMLELNDHTVEHLAQTAWSLQCDADCLNLQAFNAMDVSKRYLFKADLIQHPQAIIRRIIRFWCSRHIGMTLSAAQTNSLLDIVFERRKVMNLNGKWRAKGGYTHIHLVCDEELEPVEYSAVCPMNILVQSFPIEIQRNPLDTGDGIHAQSLPLDQLQGCTIRLRQKGDYIHPFGTTGKKSLSDYFIDKKIDQPFRNMIPLLCKEHEVLWVAGVGAGRIEKWNPIKENCQIKVKNLPWQRQEK